MAETVKVAKGIEIQWVVTTRTNRDKESGKGRFRNRPKSTEGRQTVRQKRQQTDNHKNKKKCNADHSDADR